MHNLLIDAYMRLMLASGTHLSTTHSDTCNYTAVGNCTTYSHVGAVATLQSLASSQHIALTDIIKPEKTLHAAKVMKCKLQGKDTVTCCTKEPRAKCLPQSYQGMQVW